MIRQLYYHGDDIKVSICVKNNSQKIVKKIVVNVVQCIDVAMFTGGHHTSRIFRVETSEVSFNLIMILVKLIIVNIIILISNDKIYKKH